MQNKHNEYFQICKGRYWRERGGPRTMGISKNVVVEMKV